MSAIRRFWNNLRRWHGELCDDCGRRYSWTVWRADDALWLRVIGPGVPSPHLLCPRCFGRRAERHGFLVWEPRLVAR